MIRLMVVDDHVETREKLVKDLTSGDLIDVIAEAGTSDEAWQMAKQLLPDIVLLDLHLPGFLTTEDLLQRMATLPNVRVVIFASQAKAADVQDLLDSGAAGYVLKSDQSALVRMAMLMVSRGSTGVISPSLPRHLTRLTPDERTILRHLTKRGQLPKAAERLGIALDELTALAERLAGKLEIESVDKLIKWAKKHGF